MKSETLLQNKNAKAFYPNITPSLFQNTVSDAMRELEQNQVLSRWCDSSAQKACDIKDFDNPEGPIFRDVRIVPFGPGRSQEDVFHSICSLGGQNGWYKYHFLWMIRGAMDKAFGGYGLNRGRRSGDELRIGDALDFWKVVDIKPGKRVLLYAQMKVPGEAWLEFDIQPDQLVQTAHFLPRGLLGRLYWYSVLPFHYLVFSDLAHTIVAGIKKDALPVE